MLDFSQKTRQKSHSLSVSIHTLTEGSSKSLKLGNLVYKFYIIRHTYFIVLTKKQVRRLDEFLSKTKNNQIFQ
jgi:hypothetical protein